MPITLFDPRTVARHFPALFDATFPQLSAGVVAHVNAEYCFIERPPANSSTLAASALAPAMLAELSFTVGIHRLLNQVEDWGKFLIIAGERQRRHYDAVIPERLTHEDVAAVEELAAPFIEMCCCISEHTKCAVSNAPAIPGFQWIASGVGDLSSASTLIEVKFSSRSFSAADYRQVVLYWLLNQLAAEESGEDAWEEFVLINPKRGFGVRGRYSDFIELISAGRSMLEIGQAFRAAVGTRGARR